MIIELLFLYQWMGKWHSSYKVKRWGMLSTASNKTGMISAARGISNLEVDGFGHDFKDTIAKNSAPILTFS